MENETTSTCIVAIVHGGKVYVGGDSAGVAGYNITIRADTKVFTRKDALKNTWVFGFTSSFRMGQLIQYELAVPMVEPEEKDLHKFMVTKFIPVLRKCLKAGAWEGKKDNQAFGGTFIVGVLGKVFVIGDNYQVGQPANEYASVGCGTQLALGALYATGKNTKMKPEERIRIALEAAEAFNAGVRSPFKIVHT